MRIVPVHMWKHLPNVENDGLVVQSKNPVLAKVMEERRKRFGATQDRVSYLVDKIASESRVIIVEGISGSGKDTFQEYLKKKLTDRDVYDYSEGDVLHSWKQLPIEGVSKLRVKFMKLFVNYMRDVINRDQQAIFLLNRFHLSTYASTIIHQPELEIEYDDIVDVLRLLPVHVFVLQLDENEIEKRSLHPERSGAWQKFQKQIAEKGSFRQRLERQQRLILESASRQPIPYSVIRLSHEAEDRDAQVDTSEFPIVLQRHEQANAAGAKISHRKRTILHTVKETA